MVGESNGDVGSEQEGSDVKTAVMDVDGCQPFVWAENWYPAGKNEDSP